MGTTRIERQGACYGYIKKKTRVSRVMGGDYDIKSISIYCITHVQHSLVLIVADKVHTDDST